jgi:hypothetical protein
MGTRLRQALPVVAEAAANPLMPEGPQKVAMEALKIGLADARLTDKQREYYETYVPQEIAAGRIPKSFDEYGKPDKYKEESSQLYAKDFKTINEAGRKAQATLGTLSAMRSAMNDPNFYSGAGAESVVLPLKRAIIALNGDPKAAASMEVFRALANKSVLDNMGGSLGTGFSNADREFVVGQVAGLQNTPDGNRALIEITEKVQKRAVEIAKLAQNYEKRNGKLDSGFERELTTWAEANPLFPEVEKEALLKTATPPEQTITTIPDGATATGPNGAKLLRQNGRWVPFT